VFTNPNGGSFAPITDTVVLDDTGHGVILFSPSGTTWKVTSVRVSVSTSVKEATVNIVNRQKRVSGTYSGSTGDIDPELNLILNDGERMGVVWDGGDPGAVATATITGSINPRGSTNVQ
jgi:hypothetical protein